MSDASALARDPGRAYRLRLKHHEEARAAAATRSHAVGTARVLVFAAIVATGLWLERGSAGLPAVALGFALAAFLALVVVHERVRARERRAADLAAVQRDGLARLERAWDRLPERPAPASTGARGATLDLDVFGRPALAQLLGPTASAAGRATLAAWLQECAAPAEVTARQQAVRELASAIDFRDEVALRARRVKPMRAAELQAFLEWAEAAPWLTTRRPVLWAARLLPPATVVFALLDYSGAVDVSLWIGTLAATAWLALGQAGRHVHATFDRAFGRESVFDELPQLLGAAESLDARAARLVALRDRVRAGGGAAASLGRLRQLMHSADARHAAGLLYLPLLLLTLWPFHVLWLMERWQQTSGRHARDWLDALAQLEALGALATLAHDQPDWCYPQVSEEADVLEADGVAHPMLAEAVRVANDVRVGPPGTFLLVTGSNMSGKSTLLRALGANVVLAGAGAPVCATSMRLPRVELQTSVRVEDSLTDGVSYFMAQLNRVRAIVSAADDAAAGGGRRVLYLLDEILAGTNSAERRVAATRVIAHLVRAGAIGVVTTHDLELASESALAAAARPVHFSETIDPHAAGAPMTFDYRLRPGVATSTNALRLMELIGLGEDADRDR